MSIVADIIDNPALGLFFGLGGAEPSTVVNTPASVNPDQPAIPKKTHPIQIKAGHSSGKWTKTDTRAFAQNVKKMRKLAGLVSRTEATDSDFNKAVNSPGDKWGVFHPSNLGRDCSVEWDETIWHPLETGVLQLTDIRIRTTKGHLQPPVCLTWVRLEHIESKYHLEFGSAHLDLSNTDLRRRANLEECHTLRARAQTYAKNAPNLNILWQMDGNRDQRNPHWQRYFMDHLAQGTKLTSGWKQPFPMMGTHGHAILDLAFANFPHTSHLGSDDSSSDHRPFVTTGTL